MSADLAAAPSARPSVGARLGNIASSLPIFTKLTLATLLATYGLGVVYARAVDYLALVPGNSIPYLWNVFTASWIETNPAALAVSCLLLIIVGEDEEARANREGRASAHNKIWGREECIEFES